MQVTGSENFCGVAEMDGPVDFEKSSDCWDRHWKGQFPVKWHITKDVPYSQFQRITFNDAENPNERSIIYCRDTQQVNIVHSIFLKVFCFSSSNYIRKWTDAGWF